MKINTENRSIWNIFSFVCLWYFYFSSSFVLRPFAQLFWIACGCVAVGAAVLYRHKFSRTELLFLLSFLLLIVFSLMSVDSFYSIRVIGNYFIYFAATSLIVNRCSKDTVCRQIMFFSSFHLLATYIQIITPTVYTTFLLPLLPADAQNEIMNQMNWNHSYFGFTVQTSMNAMYLSIGAILCAVKIKKENDIGTNIILLVLSALFVVAVFFTVRRGSSAALLFILALMYLKYRNSVAAKILIVPAGLLLILIVGINTIPGIGNLIGKANILSSAGGVWNGRDAIFSNAFKAILERPVFGFGGGQIGVAIGRTFLENSYLSVLIQWGIIGCIFFYMPYVSVILDNKAFMKAQAVDHTAKFSFYIIVLYLLMSLVEDYFGAPINIFIFLLVTLSPANKEPESLDQKESVELG